ncbi:MAG: iron-sulfur cluster-binding domain-containing protein [Anaerolineales bacterium]|nr:iron-sulfur cluster-binding domain-containing protein [Anaerolineales bacterium]
MKIKVKGRIRDLLAFRRLVPARRKRFASAPVLSRGAAPLNQLVGQLHPARQNLIVSQVRQETPTTRTFRLTADSESGTSSLAPFRAGQYLSLKLEVNGSTITRPYSISSAPFEAAGTDGYYEITIRKNENGFLTPRIWENWNVGTRIVSSEPTGLFYHEPLRDSRRIVGLAGGSGIAPFCSMAKEIVSGSMDALLLLLYGSVSREDIVFYDQLSALEIEAPENIRVVHVLSSGEKAEGFEQGLLTADLIRKTADVENSTFFICGPQVMYDFVFNELAQLNLPQRRIRSEVYGSAVHIEQAPGYPLEAAGQTFHVKVHIGGVTANLAALAGESLLVTMERAGLAPPSRCRSGECGWCHSHLVSGEVYIHPGRDGRRAADLKYGWIHPCSSYPISDLEISVPRGDQ